jgi:hypothetical protein
MELPQAQQSCLIKLAKRRESWVLSGAYQIIDGRSATALVRREFAERWDQQVHSGAHYRITPAGLSYARDVLGFTAPA